MMKELNNYFEEKEKKYMVDMVNGLLRSSVLSARDFVKITISDSDNWDRLGEKWNVDVNKLIEKVEKLEDSEIEVVVNSLYKFWDNDKRDLHNITIGN